MFLEDMHNPVLERPSRGWY